MCLMSYANDKGADEPAHPLSLISAFVVRCLDSIISLDSIAEISRLYLASVAAQAGLCLAWSETPVDTFCCVVVQLYLTKIPFLSALLICWMSTRCSVHALPFPYHLVAVWSRKSRISTCTIYMLYWWILHNAFTPGGLSQPCITAESICHLKDVWCPFSFLFYL